MRTYDFLDGMKVGVYIKGKDQFLFPMLRKDNACAQQKESRCSVKLRISC